MSTTVIHGFDLDGVCTDEITEAHNAWRGAMAIWKILERKYLPKYRPRYVPDWIQDDEVNEYLGFEPTRINGTDPDAMKEVWQLFTNANVSTTDRIVFGTTLDNALVKRENIPKVIEAFEEFDKEHEGLTNLKEQADGLRAFYADEKISAVGWNQTSINGDDWSNFGGYEEDEDGEETPVPYNFNTGDKHWWLFDELEKATEANHE